MYKINKYQSSSEISSPLIKLFIKHSYSIVYYLDVYMARVISDHYFLVLDSGSGIVGIGSKTTFLLIDFRIIFISKYSSKKSS